MNPQTLGIALYPAIRKASGLATRGGGLQAAAMLFVAIEAESECLGGGQSDRKCYVSSALPNPSGFPTASVLTQIFGATVGGASRFIKRLSHPAGGPRSHRALLD